MNDDSQQPPIITTNADYDIEFFSDFEKIMYGPLLFLAVADRLRIMNLHTFEGLNGIWSLWTTASIEKSTHE
jgi:hypothetical protein